MSATILDVALKAASVAVPGLAPAIAIADGLGVTGWLSDHLFGSRGASVAAAVSEAAQKIAGTTDPAAIRGLDPDKAAALRVRLAEIAAEERAAERAERQAERDAERDALRAQLADVASARAQTVSLAQAGSRVQWAPVVISALVLATFGIVMWAALTRTLPAGSETILNMLLGTLAAMATSTVGYWVGSSAGSAQKTDMLYRSTPTQGGGAVTGPFAR